MKLHNWMALMTMPVEAVVVDGRIDISHTELAEELAKEDAVVACWACDVVLTAETLDTECQKVPAQLL